MSTFDQDTATPRGLPLPPVLHAAAEPVSSSGRVILIGDIHGCCDELELLLEKCAVTADDTVVLVGDLVNKGPKSREVVALSRARGFLAVRGNHDDAALASYEEWRLSGKDAEVIKAGHSWVTEMAEEDVAYMHSLPFSLTLKSHELVVVHAGLVPGVPLEEQSLTNLYKMRDLLPLESLDATGGVLTSSYEAAERSGDERTVAWASCWPGPDLIVFGHDAVRGVQQHPKAVGLDSGCCYGGKLTACILPPRGEGGGAAGGPHEYELVAVDALEQYEAPSSKD